MKTVLLAWELGAGLGHVGPLWQLARELHRVGHRPVFALRDVVGVRAFLATDDFPILQAPVWPLTARLFGRGVQISSYADILALHGFANADDLGAMVSAWDRLLELVKPDLIVAESSPTLCLSAYGTYPIAVMGNGFAVPPVHDQRFPPLMPNRPPLMAESRVFEAVQTVQARRKRALLSRLTRIFDTPLRAITSFLELDPYRNARREPLLGPLEPLPPLVPRPAESRIFAYLEDDHSGLETIVECLAEVEVPADIYLRGEVGAFRRLLAARGATVHERPPPFGMVMPRASVVLSHAGSATAHAALAAGRPQLAFPLHLESEMTARALEGLGVGLRVGSNATKAEIARAIAQILEDGALAAKAVTTAEAVAPRAARDALGTVVAACNQLLA